MSRKNKIIVSVVGITIVLLALLGITYAYYLTRIQGNTNTNSISITTANLLLKYDDGSGAIVEENIMPGVTFTKTFSVTNEGNAKIDNYVVYLEEVVNDLTRTEDLTYTLTCDNCSGSEGEYPSLAGIIATNSIEVGQTHNYTLTITYENLPNTDQSIDMGSRISGYIQIYNLQDIVDLTGSVTNAVDGDYVQINSVQKISQIVDGKYTLGAIEPGNHTITVRYIDENDEEQIRSTKTITIQKGDTAGVSGDTITVNDYSQMINLDIDATDSNNYIISSEILPFGKGTLAYNILKNSKENRNGTEYKNEPLSIPAQDNSLENEKVLSLTLDDYGTSYYFRGSVEDNYVTFADMCWRIVRIQGDGSIKLILEDQNVVCNDNSFTGNWSIPLAQGSSVYAERFGSKSYAPGKLIASDGTTNAETITTINYLHADNANLSLSLAFRSFQNTLTEAELLNLKSGDWCLNDKAYSSYTDNSISLTETEVVDKRINNIGFYYDSFVRLNGKSTKEPTYKCSGTLMTTWEDNETNSTPMYVGTITADEIAFAGGIYNESYYSYWLINNYQKTSKKSFWTFSPNYYDEIYRIDSMMSFYSDGSIYTSHVIAALAYRPSIIIKTGKLTSAGEGTLSNPYVIN